MKGCDMRRVVVVTFGLILAATGALVGQMQEPNMVETHVGHVMSGFQGTPKMEGLLPTAFAEVRIAEQHAVLAMRDPTNLDAIKLHAGHVINALDPSVVTAGPGLGFGVKQAAAGVAQHVGLAAKVPGASANVGTHAAHVTGAANHVVAKTDEIVALAQRVRAQTNPGLATILMARVQTAVGQLEVGIDQNRDRRIDWAAPEGGLAQAQQHMELLISSCTWNC